MYILCKIGSDSYDKMFSVTLDITVKQKCFGELGSNTYNKNVFGK